MSDKKKYNATIAGAYKTKVGFWSLDINAETYEAIQKIELGGRLVLTVRTEESKAKAKDPSKAFDAFFNYMTPEEVTAWKSRSKENSGRPPSSLGRQAPTNSDDTDF